MLVVSGALNRLLSGACRATHTLLCRDWPRELVDAAARVTHFVAALLLIGRYQPGEVGEWRAGGSVEWLIERINNPGPAAVTHQARFDGGPANGHRRQL